jgi:hypothetical protein
MPSAGSATFFLFLLTATLELASPELASVGGGGRGRGNENAAITNGIGLGSHRGAIYQIKTTIVNGELAD